jgi:hypothetical protein
MKAQKGSIGIVLLFLNLGARWRVGCQRHVPAALPSGKRPHTHCTGDWVDPGAGRVG